MSRTQRSPDPFTTVRGDPKWKTTCDGKHWFKPPSTFKRITSAQRKARAKQALRTMGDPDAIVIPEEPKSDVWKWT